MTRVLPVVVGASLALAAPVAHGDHLNANFVDLSSIATMPAGDDASPAIAGTAGDAIWLAWMRVPTAADALPPLFAVHVTDTSGTLTLTQTSPGFNVSGIGLSHDGTDPVVFVTHGGASNQPAADLYAWRPRASATSIVGLGFGSAGSVSDVQAAQVGSISDFDVGIATQGPEVLTVQPFATAGYATFQVLGGRSYTGATGVAAAQSLAANTGLYAVANNQTSTPAVVIANRAGNNSPIGVPSTVLHVAATNIPSGGFRVAALLQGDTVTEFDIPTDTLTPTAERQITFAATNLAEVAVAPDPVTSGAWSVALASAPDTLWVAVESTTPGSVPVTQTYDLCSHLEAATTPAYPNSIFVTMACRYQQGARHVLLFIIGRPPMDVADDVPDAASDALGDATEQGQQDASPGLDATQSVASDASTDGSGRSTGDVVIVSGSDGGILSVAGSGCACSTGGSTPVDRAAFAWMGVATALGIAFSFRRRTSRQ